jgi:hypothetical protein
MKRNVSFVLCALAVLLLFTPLAAQSPAGWMVRVDRSTNASDPDSAGSVKFTKTATGFHATNPQAAVYWNPSNTATGVYSLKGTFKLLKPSSHTNFYGIVFGGSDLGGAIVFGGSDLGGAAQTYTYFTVAQDGSFLIKHRDGNNTSDVARANNAAVKRPDASGQSVNTLEVKVGADKVEYLVNNTVVHTSPKTGATAKTDGLYGIRVNHALEVEIDGLAKS